MFALFVPYLIWIAFTTLVFNLLSGWWDNHTYNHARYLCTDDLTIPNRCSVYFTVSLFWAIIALSTDNHCPSGIRLCYDGMRTHLDPGLSQVRLHCNLFTCVDVWIVCLGERSLEFLQLSAGERRPDATLFPLLRTQRRWIHVSRDATACRWHVMMMMIHLVWKSGSCKSRSESFIQTCSPPRVNWSQKV
jgi:hypothetical protein